MQIATEHMAAVVAEASQKMQDPDFSASVVGEFVDSQMAITQYVTASEAELGGAEGVVAVIFHAGLLTRAIERALEVPCPIVGFDDLDRAARGNFGKTLEKTQPALYEFITGNIEDKERQRLLYLAGVALTISISDI